MKTVFAGKTVGIRPYRMDDVIPLHEAAVESSPHVYKFLPWCHPDYTIEESRAWVTSQIEAWRRADEYGFVIYSVNNNEFFGGIGINRIDRAQQSGNIGYWVRKKALNQGVASEAVILIKTFGFTQLGLNRLEIVTGVDNKASRRVAEKVGARFEGILERKPMNKSVAVNMAVYSLVKKI